MIDLHVHSTVSHDAKSTIDEHCAAALEKGLVEIGFSEHLDLCPTDKHCGLHDYARYKSEIESARKKFPGLKIRMGVEVSFLPADLAAVAAFLSGKDYDYALAAIHLVADGKFTVSEREPCLAYFATKTPEECYREYFGIALAAVRSGLFDGLAHLDIINRYGLEVEPEWEWRSYYAVLREIFEGVIKRNIALEINTSGYRQQPCRPYPDKDVIKLYRELGGNMITVGSDAHNTDNLGSGVPQAIKLAQSLGFKQLTSFERRVPQCLELKN
jgi:histidinol-phosphatase (PHP family)